MSVLPEPKRSAGAAPRAKPAWAPIVARYQRPDTRMAVGQLLNTLLPFFALWYLAYLSLRVSYALTLVLAVVAGLLLLRVFIFQHDCGHGSFVASRRWNDIIGSACSVLTLTPYIAWRHNHAVHHAHAGDLDERGTGDVWTLTVREYRALPWHQRLAYRVYRHPLTMFGLGPLFHFAVLQRIPAQARTPRQRWSVHGTTLALLLAGWAMVSLVGWRAFLLVHVPIITVMATVGVFLFYVQHQFEDMHWARGDEWDYAAAALEGSSHFRLPAVLQWFTGNIGLHHIHHLSPRIPNYRLQACHDENPMFHDVPTLTLRSSFQTLRLALWDEDSCRLVSFREAASLPG